MNLFILLSALLLALLSNGALGSALEEPHLLRRHVDLGTSTLEGGDVKNYLMPDGRFYLEFWKSSKTMERRSHGESDDGCGGLPGPDYTVTEEPNGQYIPNQMPRTRDNRTSRQRHMAYGQWHGDPEPQRAARAT